MRAPSLPWIPLIASYLAFRVYSIFRRAASTVFNASLPTNSFRLVSDSFTKDLTYTLNLVVKSAVVALGLAATGWLVPVAFISEFVN